MVNVYEDMKKGIGPVATYYLFYKKIGLYLQKFMITERFWFFFFFFDGRAIIHRHLLY